MDPFIVQLLLAGGVILLLIALWAAQRSRHPFDARDMLMDHATGKASLNAGVLLLMALLAAWVVIDRENDGRDDVPNLLIGVLGIFVLGRVGAHAIAQFGQKPPKAPKPPADAKAKR